MKGDFSRNTFLPDHFFTQVLLQQGRVLLDADWNEQSAILLELLRLYVRDIIGPHGGPPGAFRIDLATDENDADIDKAFEALKERGIVVPAQLRNRWGRYATRKQVLKIMPGRYYVDGLMVENPQVALYDLQPWTVTDWTKRPSLDIEGQHVLYLDVFERTITSAQYDSIRDVALGEADTSARTQPVWRVGVINEVAAADITNMFPAGDAAIRHTGWQQFINTYIPEASSVEKLRARIDRDQRNVDDPGRLDNQLLRVEIHSSGTDGVATFKTSYDNVGYSYAVESINGDVITLKYFPSDRTRLLDVGDMVELIDDAAEITRGYGSLAQVTGTDPQARTVTLNRKVFPDSTGFDDYSPTRRAVLRRWDHVSNTDDGAVLVEEGQPILLPGNIEITFGYDQDDTPNPGTYQAGHYWLIPLRTQQDDVLWPRDTKGEAAFVASQGRHHYAPLAIIEVNANNQITLKKALRHEFVSLAKPVDAN